MKPLEVTAKITILVGIPEDSEDEWESATLAAEKRIEEAFGGSARLGEYYEVVEHQD